MPGVQSHELLKVCAQGKRWEPFQKNVYAVHQYIYIFMFTQKPVFPDNLDSWVDTTLLSSIPTFCLPVFLQTWRIDIHLFLETSTPEDPEDEEGNSSEEEPRKGNRGPRNRPSIYEKVLAIREADRLIDSGMTAGVEKKVMETFPNLFASYSNGKFHMKSGMLGRWLTQADQQQWRMIPWDRMSAVDRGMKELPDWIRIPMGQPPRIIEKFKEGRNIPKAVWPGWWKWWVSLLVEQTESRVDPWAQQLWKEKQRNCLKSTLKPKRKRQKKSGIKVPDAKTTVTTRWCKRLLEILWLQRENP